jgi:hyperosmotically inducible protein
LADKVRHEILMLPYYSVFDEIGFSIEGNNTVVLMGEVRRPTLKSDAGAVVRRIEGVEKVVNNIEVLPLSPMDNSIRWATYRAIFSRPGFEKYGIQAISPIRIIVKNGHITLDGFVATQGDKIMAEMAARGVPFAFSVTDNLKVG